MLTSAAAQGSCETFKKAMELTGTEIWRFGEVRNLIYPLDQLETNLEEENGNLPSVLRLLVQHRRHDHLAGVRQVRKLLRDKWARYGRRIHLIQLATFLLALVLVTLELLSLDQQLHLDVGDGIDWQHVALLFATLLMAATRLASRRRILKCGLDFAYYVARLIRRPSRRKLFQIPWFVFTSLLDSDWPFIIFVIIAVFISFSINP